MMDKIVDALSRSESIEEIQSSPDTFLGNVIDASIDEWMVVDQEISLGNMIVQNIDEIVNNERIVMEKSIEREKSKSVLRSLIRKNSYLSKKRIKLLTSVYVGGSLLLLVPLQGSLPCDHSFALQRNHAEQMLCSQVNPIS